MTPDMMPMQPPAGPERTKGYKPRRRKRKAIACLLSALFPGLGHLYLRLFFRAIAFIYFVLIDASALIYFSSVRMAINVPLLVLLGLLIPAAYFYSIYDVLQSTDALNARMRREPEAHGGRPPEAGRNPGSGVGQGIRASILLVGGGALMFLLRQKPVWLQDLIQYGAEYIVSAALIMTALIMMVREGRRRYWRSGRLTAAALLLSVAVLLLLDKFTGLDDMLLLRKWWPLLFVFWGLEHILALVWNFRKKLRPKRLLRVDAQGLLLSMFISFSVFAVTQQDHYMHLWNRVSLDLTAAGTEYSAQEGYRVEKPELEIPIDLDTGKSRSTESTGISK